MKSIELAEENKLLYQWDLNRQVKITLPVGMSANEVHFAHPRDKEALVVRTKEQDGELVADIPNILLQSSQIIKVWLVSETRTIHGMNLTVIERIKPADYAYEETEILRIADIEKRIAELAAVVAYIEVEGSTDLNEFMFSCDDKGNVTLILPGAIISDDGKGNVTIEYPGLQISADNGDLLITA